MISIRSFLAAVTVAASMLVSVTASAAVVEYITPTQVWGGNGCINGGFGSSISEGCVGGEGTVTTTVATIAGLSTHISFDSSICCNGYEYVQWNGNTLSYLGNGHYDFDVIALGNDFLAFIGRNDPAFNYMTNISVTQDVPEPSALALVGLALAGLALRARRKA